MCGLCGNYDENADNDISIGDEVGCLEQVMASQCDKIFIFLRCQGFLQSERIRKQIGYQIKSCGRRKSLRTFTTGHASSVRKVQRFYAPQFRTEVQFTGR